MLAEGGKTVNTGKAYMTGSCKKRIRREETGLDADENDDRLVERKRSATPVHVSA